MPCLYHFSLDPYARRMRLALAEYGIEATYQEERPWQPSQALLALNPSGPAGLTPIYVEDNGAAVCGAEALTEYLEETSDGSSQLLPGTALQRAEIRRLVAWFDVKFYAEVTEPVLTERVIRRFVAAANGSSAPDPARVRAASSNIRPHLGYVSYLAEQQSWLAGSELSLADLAAAAHLSALDYLGFVPWGDYPLVQTWFGRIKSRPSFRILLADHIPGVGAEGAISDQYF
jgi:glutathione S-transferase